MYTLYDNVKYIIQWKLEFIIYPLFDLNFLNTL